MLGNVKSFLMSVPGVAQLRKTQFKNSVDYWDKRYREGGDSGAGSYNRLAEFKARFLNAFVEKNRVSSVIEHGCGDGAQLKLAHYPSYTGIDISPKAVEICRALFVGDPTKRFFQANLLPAGTRADLALSLDVIYHLVEDQVFEPYMEKLFASAGNFAIVYSSNMVKEWPQKHVRHRRFTDWIAKHRPEWSLESTTPNEFPYDPAHPDNTSFADFYVFAKS